MPRFTFQSPENNKRAAAIAAELLKQDFDILCFEKAFDAGAREVLWNELRARYPNKYGPANNGFSLKVNSGVWVLSRLPLTELGETQFHDCELAQLAARGVEQLDEVRHVDGAQAAGEER